MAEAFLVDAVRTPVGRRGGGLAGVHPADLGAHALSALMARTGVDPRAVDDVVLGCVDTIGPKAGDIARTAWLAAGLPEEVPGVTVDRQCGSSQQAVHFAAQAVLSGTADLVVAGGMQNMSMIPIAAAMTAGRALGFDDPFGGSAGWRARYGTQEISQFRAADLIAQRWGIGRAEMEQYALHSHQRAAAAISAGAFDAEIVPYGAASVDGCPRPDTSAAKMAARKPLRDGGVITAALSSQIADAAAALLIASPAAVRAHGLRPRARICHLSARGDDPVMMLTAPITATAHVLKRAGMTLDQIDLVEINEAFAPVVLAWQRETGADLARVNVCGGAQVARLALADELRPAQPGYRPERGRGPGRTGPGRSARPPGQARFRQKLAILLAMSIAEQMPLADVKNRLSEVVDRLQREHGRVVITRHGHPAAVVISLEDLESLEETLDVMDSAALLSDIRASLAELGTTDAPTLSKEEALRLIADR